MFPSASFQYVLYGMNFITEPPRKKRENRLTEAEKLFNENVNTTQKLLAALPTNRELINKIKQYGLPKI